MTKHNSVSVVVVGGGIIGATTLHELARRGVQASLYERNAFGNESTGKSAAIVRMHYSNPDVVRMALRSLEALRSLHEVVGSEPVYHESGWLFLVDEEDAEFARTNRLMQVAEGVQSTELEMADLSELSPGIVTDGIGCALFEPTSGYADPVAATEAFILAAQRAGAQAYDYSPVERLIHRDGRICGVVVDGQEVKSDCVVLAAGAWSVRLAADVSLKLPMKITREQDVIYATGAAAPVPFSVSDQADRVYLRPVTENRQSTQLVGRGFPKQYEYVDPDNYVQDIDRRFERDVHARLQRRWPAFINARPVSSRVGLYSVPPDWHPLLGPVDGIPGLHLATGGSGHCFKLAPAIGELVASAIVGDPVDWASIERFSVHRFELGEVFQSTFGGNRA